MWSISYHFESELSLRVFKNKNYTKKQGLYQLRGIDLPPLLFLSDLKVGLIGRQNFMWIIPREVGNYYPAVQNSPFIFIW